MKDWIYIGIFLKEKSKKELMDTYKLPEGWMYYCDHMTVVYNDHSELAEIVKQINMNNLGKLFTLKVIAVGVSEKALALKVELPVTVVCANKIPHITVGVSLDGKPVDSNNITTWNNCWNYIEVIGTMMMKVNK